ncbi:hypothetical protein [Halomonas sp. QHL1]
MLRRASFRGTAFRGATFTLL